MVTTHTAANSVPKFNEDGLRHETLPLVDGPVHRPGKY